MAAMSPATSATPAVPDSVPVWAYALAAVAVLWFYLLTQENGLLLSAGGAELLHELTHDARHALGVPCH